LDAPTFARLLGPLAALVLAGGWVLAIAAFFLVGTETCVTTQVPLVGGIETCQDTTSTAVVMVAAIGFAATAGAVVLWALRYVITALSAIDDNTRP
jgi:hypothetical protein